jgi:hypothetical protein
MSVFPNNCTLIFTKDTPSDQRDAMGNPIIVKTLSTVQASVKVDTSRQGRAIVEPGDDPNLIYLIGYCVSPKYLPANARPNAKAKCTIKDLASGLIQEGEFTVTLITQPRWKQITRALGSKFEGYFIHA